ncbi:MAG: hypothetical protein ACRDVP_02105 [Acidimicrobiales bacterium]
MTTPLEGSQDRDEPLNGLDAKALVEHALEIVNGAKTMPLSASVLISRDEVASLLVLALERLPVELREARWLLKERDEFMAQRDREAEALMEEVRKQAERMVSRTDIVRQANLVAQRILDDANGEARRMRHETEDYCDQRLAGMEIVLDRTMRTVRAGRQKLQATRSTQEPAPSVQAGGAADEGGAESFFDQDLS